MAKITYQYINLPIAPILLTANENLSTGSPELSGVYFVGQKHAVIPNNEYYQQQDLSIFHKTYLELIEYLNGTRQEFTIAYNITGTDFQKKVLAQLCTIQYGQVVSYQQVAKAISSPNSSRAVANAIASNRLSIIIPCHRVIGSNSKLTGYAGGLEIKQQLLKLESNSLQSKRVSH